MRKILSGFCASALAVTFAVSSAVPLNAAPIVVPKAHSTTDVQLVQQGSPEWKRRINRMQRADRRDFRQNLRQDRRDFRQDRRQLRRVQRRGGYYNGYRGYRDYRPGYRRHNDFWFPAAAFITGAIVGGAISNAPRGGSAHVQWCYDRYRSYRASDNTYQPYSGPRRQCNSPY